MKTDDFDYDLPERLIAQTPLENRSDSKLLLLDRETGNIEHEKFSNIINELLPGDVLVLNDTKVIPARLYGVKAETEASIELLLLNESENDVWNCLVKPGRRVHIGTTIFFGKGLLKATCLTDEVDGIKSFKFEYNGDFYQILDQLGEMPLPPYIHETLEERDRYQTVYALKKGSVAAPTAGLHFTETLLKEIRNKGVIITYITLHVGIGTFRPVKVDDVKKHIMHEEYYEMSEETSKILTLAKQEGRRIIAVGTTSCRTLETIYQKYQEFKVCSGISNIFIYPGFTFQAIDGLITNFHLPKSTLIMLVSAFASKEYIMESYKEAILNNYRFFSFGDSMFIK